MNKFAGKNRYPASSTYGVKPSVPNAPSESINGRNLIERESPGTNTFITSIGRLAQIVENRKGKAKLHQQMRQNPTKCIASKEGVLSTWS